MKHFEFLLEQICGGCMRSLKIPFKSYSEGVRFYWGNEVLYLDFIQILPSIDFVEILWYVFVFSLTRNLRKPQALYSLKNSFT